MVFPMLGWGTTRRAHVAAAFEAMEYDRDDPARFATIVTDAESAMWQPT
jgi:hypothetical protein